MTTKVGEVTTKVDEVTTRVGNVEEKIEQNHEALLEHMTHMSKKIDLVKNQQQLPTDRPSQPQLQWNGKSAGAGQMVPFGWPYPMYPQPYPQPYPPPYPPQPYPQSYPQQQYQSPVHVNVVASRPEQSGVCNTPKTGHSIAFLFL